MIKKDEFNAILDQHIHSMAGDKPTEMKDTVKKTKAVPQPRVRKPSNHTEEYESESESEEEEERLPVNWDDVYRKEKVKVINGQSYTLHQKEFIEKLQFNEDQALKT